MLMGLNGNADVLTDGSFNMALDDGDQIGQHSPYSFRTSGKLYHFYSSNYTSSSSGNWNTHLTGLFAGVRLTKNNQEYYGWIRIKMVNEEKFIVTDMALGVPFMNIVAGDTTAMGAISLNESISQDIELWTVNDQLLIENRSDQNYDLRLFDLSGSNILDQEAIEEKDFRVSTANWTNGVYIAAIRQENGKIFRRKILVQ